MGIVVALIIGAIGGYLFSGLAPASPTKNSSTSGSAMTQTSSASPKTNDEKIANAMSAAPGVIGKDATILDWPAKEGDSFPTLRAGTNGWTCLPDMPPSPGNDPICVDAAAMQWFGAYLEHKTPKLVQDGLGYMLQGASDASNVDPYATGPKQGESWVSAPAHIMVFPSQKLDTKVYGTDPYSGKPWIMWADTPYAHLMVPVE